MYAYYLPHLALLFLSIFVAIVRCPVHQSVGYDHGHYCSVCTALIARVQVSAWQRYGGPDQVRYTFCVFRSIDLALWLVEYRAPAENHEDRPMLPSLPAPSGASVRIVKRSRCVRASQEQTSFLGSSRKVTCLAHTSLICHQVGRDPAWNDTCCYHTPHAMTGPLLSSTHQAREVFRAVDGREGERRTG